MRAVIAAHRSTQGTAPNYYFSFGEIILDFDFDTVEMEPG
jgi:hypothetical protein